jgi:hypothetical protein
MKQGYGLRHVFLLFLIFSLGACGSSGVSWRDADRSSAGIAPLPQDEPRAVVQVYYARAFSWRGNFAVHSWISTKDKNSDGYTSYHVIGWQLRRSNSSIVITENAIPDARWFGAEPTLLRDLRGPKAEEAIAKIQTAVHDYPHAGSYRIWPGPNSNTFVSYVMKQTPEIGVELPPHAVGREWISNYCPLSVSESNTGFHFSLLGLLGFSLGLNEGVEVSALGLTFGVDFWRPALKIPMAGRLGFPDAPINE